ncbi:MAG: phosphate ABC transporter permease PstA [Acidobacteriota bacterium]|nr:phosphate ABC transporter permease PstA [Acidobacteriota bacterium]
MRARRHNHERGEAGIWLAGSALSICLLMIAGMIALILTNGLGFFWPGPLEQLTLTDGTTVLGEVTAREPIPQPGTPEHLTQFRIQLKLGNRDLTGNDFRWIDETAIASRSLPHDAVYIERREYGPFLGYAVALTSEGLDVATGSAAVLPRLAGLVDKAARDRDALRELERDELGAVNHRIEQARLRLRALDLEEQRSPGSGAAERAELERDVIVLQQEYTVLEATLMTAADEAGRLRVRLRAADGTEKELAALDLYRAYPANQLSTPMRARVYASRLWEFLSSDPRESNTEGGILPAIFGTVMMVVLMSVLAVPFGVLAALYLREYARQGFLVRAVRIAVNNLAGVPSIVFGVFGLGFFVYLVGGSIDAAFYPERLPAPTYGTGGILWASLTLALLTVPVVIVASEEALAAVPRSMREASLASGATTLQTLLRVVLPSAAPGILTGLILAMARGAGEVAPLMITGVVKLAPDLPVDGYFPYVHLERKFMHLGFHIYDVGFQSPNVEAAKPMVYATAILLLLIVLLLNLTAIIVRSRLRRKFQSAAF